MQVSGPFHSSLMKPADEKVLKFLESIKITSPIVPLISNVTAKEENDPKVIKALLAKQVISRVKWREMVLYMASRGINKFVEIGPNKVLSNLVKRIISTKSVGSIGDMDNFFNESLILTAENLKVGLS